MKFSIIQLKHLLIATVLMTSAPWVQATCYRVNNPVPGNRTNQIPQAVVDLGYTASNWENNATWAPITFGVINIGTGSTSLVPAGTVLASTNVSFVSSALHRPYTANQILFKCDLADADQLYEMYGTVGTLKYYGGYEVNDVDGGYATPAENIAYRITNLKTGLYYTHLWQERQLTSADYITVGNYIYIPATAFSDITFELLKTDDTGMAPYPARDVLGEIVSPQGSIVFKGPYLAEGVTAGAQSTDPIAAAGSEAPAIWGMGRGTPVIRGNTCVVSDFDQVVTLPPISASELNLGNASVNPFSVSIECDAGAISGTETSLTNPPVAMGFLVTQPTALAQADTLGLKNTTGGISHLLDDNYGTTGTASGVGIRLYSAGDPLTLLSTRAATGTGNAAGWYGFTDLLADAGPTPSGGNKYSGTFTASLEKLPGSQATAGSVNAQAQIFVSLQ